MSRLGGSKRKLVKPIAPEVTRLHRFVIPSMTEAMRLSRRPVWKTGESEVNKMVRAAIGNGPVDGNPVRLSHQMEVSEALVEEAIALDPRLARKASWVRRDEGEHVDAALLAQGDDAPFFKRTKTRVTNGYDGDIERVCVVISTDSNKVGPDTAAAFIATARLVQQFVPLEIWWQGAWLTQDRIKGFVCFAPLTAGDMDFSRLDYCIADDTRDSFSFRAMSSHAVWDAGESWRGCQYQATYSLLPDRDAIFVPHTGISPNGESVAAQAARWLGWDSVWSVKYEQEKVITGALQELPRESTPYKPPTPEEQAESDRRWKLSVAEREAREAEKAAARMAAIEH
jgi:hypothetical protein